MAGVGRRNLDVSLEGSVPAARRRRHDILAELRAIEDFHTQLQVEQILDNIEEPQKGQQALVAAYDPAEVNEVRAYNIGDGEAMSGLLLAGQRTNGEATFLVFLMD